MDAYAGSVCLCWTLSNARKPKICHSSMAQQATEQRKKRAGRATGANAPSPCRDVAAPSLRPMGCRSSHPFLHPFASVTDPRDKGFQSPKPLALLVLETRSQALSFAGYQVHETSSHSPKTSFPSAIALRSTLLATSADASGWSSASGPPLGSDKPGLASCPHALRGNYFGGLAAW